MKKHWVFLFFLLLSPWAFAEGETPAPATPAAAPAGLDWGMNLGLGTEVMDGVLYQTLSLQPDIPLGPLGIGLDLRFHFQFYETPGGPFGIYPRAKDWYDSSMSFSQNLDKYLSQITYIRWEKKGAPLYAQLGVIQNGTLGNGFILGGYDNTVLRPEKKYIGLSFDLDGALFDFPFFGFETFTSNVSSFDVLGGRFYIRPLIKTGIPVLDNMQIGGTLVVDQNPYFWFTPINTTTMLPYPVASELVKVYGADITIPFLKSEIASMKVYGDLAFQEDRMGVAFGVAGDLLMGLFSYKLEGRNVAANFIPTYFDQAYDLNRQNKFLTYKNNSDYATPGYFGYKGELGTNILKDMLVFAVTLEGPFSEVNSVDAAEKYPKLRGNFKFEHKDIPVTASAFYFKDKIMSLQELVSPDNARIGAQVGYKMGPAVISMVYSLRYIPETDPKFNPNNRWEITSRLETAIKLK